MDVKNVFLNGNLIEKVYMRPSLGSSVSPTKFPVLGLPSSVLLFVTLNSPLVPMILLCLYVRQSVVLLFFFSMWMI